MVSLVSLKEDILLTESLLYSNDMQTLRRCFNNDNPDPMRDLVANANKVIYGDVDRSDLNNNTYGPQFSWRLSPL
jgi:hypothetical protein